MMRFGLSLLMVLSSTLMVNAWSWTGDPEGQKLDQEARHFLTSQNVCGIRLKSSFLIDLDKRITRHHKGWKEYERFLIDSVTRANAEYVRQTPVADRKKECEKRLDEVASKEILDAASPNAKADRRGKFDINSWVGIWTADASWCRYADQIGDHDPAPVRIDPSNIIGLETNCSISSSRISYTPDKWSITARCTGDGEIFTDKRTFIVSSDFDRLTVIFSDKRTAEFTRCR